MRFLRRIKTLGFEKQIQRKEVSYSASIWMSQVIQTKSANGKISGVPITNIPCRIGCLIEFKGDVFSLISKAKSHLVYASP